MKKSEIVLNFEEEKLDALAYFLGSTPAAAARPRPKRPAKPARRNAETGDTAIMPETAREEDVAGGQP